MSPRQDPGASTSGDEAKKPDVTLKIPRPLYERIATMIDTEPTGFRSPTEFILFVLRLVTGTDPEAVEQLRDRLRSLGYLDEKA